MRAVTKVLHRLIARPSGRDRVLHLFGAGTVGAEIGVYKGDFSARILSTCHPARLHLIDPWRFEASDQYSDSWYGPGQGVDQANMDEIHDSVARRFQAPIEAGTVVMHRMASADASAEFPDEYFDWVYIDGNHLYEYVMQDLRGFLPKVKPGGLLAGDDYQEGGWWQGGVKRAVDEFRSSSPVETVMLNHAQFVLRKR